MSKFNQVQTCLNWHFLTPANLEHPASQSTQRQYQKVYYKACIFKQVSSNLSKFDQSEASSNVTEAFCYQESLISTNNLEHQSCQSTADSTKKQSLTWNTRSFQSSMSLNKTQWYQKKKQIVCQDQIRSSFFNISAFVQV